MCFCSIGRCATGALPKSPLKVTPVDCVPGEALIDLECGHKLFTGIKITFALAAYVYELPLAIRLGNKVKLVSFVVDDFSRNLTRGKSAPPSSPGRKPSERNR